ncbi:uncharacterized protein LOC125305368 isoform X2 [Alosa alosa]|uniref:uncharacterized protein LOC125305368 isoform X2 n=1 Tax=Alosa alosa TaxID=278164 RepID=UPI002015221F|nr:uncharacterized protein LOC125305368 isoform X2 [Alosa alosa]
MDHNESSYSPRRCIEHKSPDNCGQPDIFYTTRLCKKLTHPRGDFDLTDPYGYKLSAAYNCLHDPNLKTYLYRKDIHKHLLKDGFITKDNKVTCNLKEYNTYKKYLTDLQREMDHRFKMEQRELVRKILILQQEGRISSDVSVPDFIEWLVFHGQDCVQNDMDRPGPGPGPKKSQSCGSNVLKLPKLKTQSKSLTLSHYSDTGRYLSGKICTRQQQILKEVEEDVQRELRLERRRKEAQHQRQQRVLPSQRNKWHQPDLAVQGRGLSGALTNIGIVSLKEGGDSLMIRRPTLKKLASLTHTEKMSNHAACPKTTVTPIGDTEKDTPRLKPRDFSDNRKISVMAPPKHVPLETNVSSNPGGIGGDSRDIVTVSQLSEQKQTEEKDEISNLMKENPQVITDIVTTVRNDMIGAIIPAMLQFINERSPDKQSSSEDTPTAHNNHIGHVEDTKPVDGSLQNACCASVLMSPQSSTHYSQKLKEPDSNKIESLPGDEFGSLNTDLFKKAERVIWKAVHEVMKTMMSSSVDKVEPKSQYTANEEYCHDLKSTSSTHEGFYDGDKALPYKQSVSLVNLQTQRESVACAEQMFMDPTAKKTQQGDDGWNQVKAQLTKPRLFFSEHNSSDSTQKNLIYSQFVEDILVRVYSLFPDESVEADSQIETTSSPSSSSSLSPSSRMQNERPPLQAEKSSSAPVYSVSAEGEHHAAQRNASARPKLQVGQTIRLLSARPVSPADEVTAVETEQYADEMVMDIMDQLKYEAEQQSRESKHSETPDSFTSSEESVVMRQDIDFPQVTELNPPSFWTPKTQHHEAVEISHQIFLSIKSQLDQGHSDTETNVSKTMEKAVLCEFVDLALKKLSTMCEPKYSISKIVEMSEHFLGRESSQPQKPHASEKALEIMENVKMEFEKTAHQHVKAVLEKGVLSDFNSCNVHRCQCTSRENLPSCQSCLRAMGDNQTELSTLASDIVFILWEKLIETSGCDTSAWSSNSETKLINLIKAISEISSLNTSATHAGSTTLKAEFAMDGINHAVQTKVRQFLAHQSKGGQRATDKAAIVDRPVDAIMNCFRTPDNSCGQEVHDSVSSTTSESAFQHSTGHNSKQTYTTSQLTCSSSPIISSSGHENFSEAFSKSAMSLLRDTYGEQTTDMKIKKDTNISIADPTFEGLVIQPHANNRALIVQRVVVEELSQCQAGSLESERNHQRSTQTPPTIKPPEVVCPGFSEQVDVVGTENLKIHGSPITQTNNLARPSPAVLYLFKPTYEKVIFKVLIKCMLGSELITKQRVLSYETRMLQDRRTQSAESMKERVKNTQRHRMLEATHAFGSLQEADSAMTTKSVKGRRPHSAASDSREVKQTSRSRGSTALNGLSLSQDHHSQSKLWRAQTQTTSASRASLNHPDMFWKNFQKAQTTLNPVTDGSGKGPSAVKANALRQQGNADKVKCPLSPQSTDRPTPPLLAEAIKDIVANLLVNIYFDRPDTPSGASSPISDPASLNLLDSVLLQIERYHQLDEVGADQLSSLHIDTQEVARSVYRDLVNYSGSCENLHCAISACEDRIVERIASSLVKLLSRSIQNTDHLSRDNLSSTASTRLCSLASTRFSSAASWITEEAGTISGDITLRSVDLIEQSSSCSLEMAENLMDAVMVELYTDPEMFGTPQPDNLNWPQLSLAELNQAATEVYKQMLEQCGSVENLQSALRSREKEVVTKMAVAIASQTYRLISLNESSDTPLPDQTSHLNDSLSIGSSPQQSGQCFIFYQTVWDIISTLLLELCKKKTHAQHLTPKLFLRSLNTLSECPGVKIINDKKQCDISNYYNVVARIALGARIKLSEHPDYWSILETLLTAKDEAAAGRVVTTIVEEILKFASHPFDVIPVLENQHTSDVCSLRAGMPCSASDNPSRDMTPVPDSVTKGTPCQSSTVGSKKVTFWPFAQVDYHSKSQAPPKMGSEMSDEAPSQHPASHLRGRRVISVKVKKHSKKGRPARPRRQKNNVDNEQTNKETQVKSLGSFLSKFFH